MSGEPIRKEICMSKGSRPRPYSVSQSTFANNYDAIFRKPDPRVRDDAQYEDEEFNTRVYLDIVVDLGEIYEDMIPVKFKMGKEKSVLNQDSPKELSVDNYIYVK